MAIALAQRPNWQVYILGTSEERGRKAAEQHPRITFHQGNAGQYQDLATVFHAVHSRHSRIDYVFANAGATENWNLLGQTPMDETIPPEPDMSVVDINYKGVMYTSYLAVHYFRQSPGGGKDTSLVITGSCGSLYPFPPSPMYSSSKRACSAFFLPHGLYRYVFVTLLTHDIKHRLDAVLGFMRCIAPGCRKEGVRVNALCPGIVRTNILSEEAWDTYFRAEDFCPMELIVKVTLLLLDGEEVVDTNNKRIDASEMYGQTLETSGPNYYLREQPAWCDDIAKSVMVKMSW